MENTKYQYLTLTIETKEQEQQEKELLLNGWIPFNVIGLYTIQFYKISE